ncbi:MAG: DUF4082 domain-containing protein [Planctomycetes bacterium]|nr:DUF4082 domain-containing protein [Planctomycetota bacterium]
MTNGTDQWYFGTEHAFDAPINNGPLVTYVGSGVYNTTLGAMPTQTWNNCNYYRDVAIEDASKNVGVTVHREVL